MSLDTRLPVIINESSSSIIVSESAEVLVQYAISRDTMAGDTLLEIKVDSREESDRFKPSAHFPNHIWKYRNRLHQAVQAHHALTVHSGV